MDALDAITQRHGVLRYRPDPVAADTIATLLQAAAAAPSPANLQPWALVVVTDPAVTVRVAHYLVEVQEQRVFADLLGLGAGDRERLMALYDGFEQTPCFIFVCLEPKVEFALPEHAEVLRQWHLVCVGAAMQNLMVAATALGLGTRWFGGFALDAGGAGIRSLLGIPRAVEVIAATPVGYHDEPPKPRPLQQREDISGFRRGDRHTLGRLLRGKLPVADVAHWERW